MLIYWREGLGGDFIGGTAPKDARRRFVMGTRAKLADTRFAKVIREALERNDEDIAWLARKTKLNPRTLTDHLQKSEEPRLSIEHWVAIFEQLNLDITDFLDRPEREKENFLSWGKIRRELDPKAVARRIRDLADQFIDSTR